MRVIFSRKGFDSSSGGRPSPILPDGRMVSLPIPESPRFAGLPGARRYADLRLAGQGTYLEAMRSLGIGQVTEGGRGIPLTEATTCHLDPDIQPGLVPRPLGWQAIFGQAGAPQSHLARQGVGVGDIFVFFGWFRRTRHEGGTLRYASDKPIHALWGYLAIGGVVPITADVDIAWAADHPHFSRRARVANTAYIASQQLDLGPGLSGLRPLPGAGTFSFSDQVRLSRPGGPARCGSYPQPSTLGWGRRRSPSIRSCPAGAPATGA
ncbi:MAG: hypothetical protein NVSMB32_01670 [Actinomycetota bacterium]